MKCRVMVIYRKWFESVSETSQFRVFPEYN